MRKLQVIALIAAVSATACDRENRMPRLNTRLSPDQFVAVMVELAKAEPRQHNVVLKKHHTTDKEIREFVSRYSSYPTVLSATFDSIQARLQRPDTAPRTR